jgi:hypothetical protein
MHFLINQSNIADIPSLACFGSQETFPRKYKKEAVGRGAAIQQVGGLGCVKGFLDLSYTNIQPIY